MPAIGKITKNTRMSSGRDSYRATVKRLAKRKSRRLGKLMLDDAPRIVTKGWAD